jgi:MoaA/NifB/PqqE/SkfB family radical SAM enzyme
MPGYRVLDLLRTARRSTDYLVITGGEPLLHPDFAFVLDHLPSIRFDGVILTTNGWDLTPHLTAVNASVRYLVFSLDTLDPIKAQRWYGHGPNVLKRILQNIEAATRLPGRKYEIILSSVATPTNIEDLADVYRFSREVCRDGDVLDI